VRGEQNRHPVVDVCPLRVVIEFFGGKRQLGHEGEGLAKIRKEKLAPDRIARAVMAPVRKALEFAGRLLCTELGLHDRLRSRLRVHWRIWYPRGAPATADARMSCAMVAAGAKGPGSADRWGMHWDIFCEVVDNFGDVGVCWRLAAELAGRGQDVRLWIDDAGALAWMAPGGCAGVAVHALDALDADFVPGDVLLAPFAARLPQIALAPIARAALIRPKAPVVIQLEYLSAEAYVERSHGLRSPVAGGAGADLRKWFFFPGFTAASGGLLREGDIAERQARFDRAAWLGARGLRWAGEPVISLFCYEPAVLGQWLLATARSPCQLLVTPGRARAALQRTLRSLPAGWNRDAFLKIDYLPELSQREFDHLLWACDCNFVRGEDSLVRALWAGAPMVWQAYPQSDDAHFAKLAAFLDWLQAPVSLRQFHQAWNGAAGAELVPLDLVRWRTVIARARTRLLAQDDLVSRLLRFVAENR